jgi:hypothetical protein
VSSSDFERARSLAQRLVGVEAGKRAQAGGFVQFPKAGAAVAVGRPRVLAPAVPTSIEPPAWPQHPPESLEVLLTWCTERAQASAGFLVDSQGFVIGTCGSLALDGDALGAELYLAFEQLERVGQNAGRLFWIDLEFAKRRIAAMRAGAPDRPQVIVVLVAPGAGYGAVRPLIEQVVLEYLPRLV